MPVEGEKDADNLWRIGIAATSSPDGAAGPGKKPKWERRHSEMLRGADLVIMGDNDLPGRAHVEATASTSVGIAWPDNAPFGDAGVGSSSILDPLQHEDGQVGKVALVWPWRAARSSARPVIRNLLSICR